MILQPYPSRIVQDGVVLGRSSQILPCKLGAHRLTGWRSPGTLIGCMAETFPMVPLTQLNDHVRAEMPPNVTVTLGARMAHQKPGPGAAMRTLGSATEDARPLNIQARDFWGFV